VPTTDKLPDGVVVLIAGQVSAFLSTADAGLESTAVAFPQEVGESLAVCTVSLAQVKKPPADLSLLAKPSGYWHHQLRTGGVATHTALSMKPGFGPTHEVEQVFATPLAGKIDDAIAWLDKNVTGRGTVRLLVIPAYLTHALLLVRPDGPLEVVLADQPAQYTRLQPEMLYPLAEFLKLLSKETPAESLG
jgi:hypothetical protein